MKQAKSNREINVMDTAKLENAAINGNIANANLVGLLFLTGEYVVKQDIYKALKSLNLAADGGCGDSAYALGIAYASGSDVPQNFKAAIKYFEKALEFGRHEAQLDLNKLQPLVNLNDRLDLIQQARDE
jgi:TPR repeat protein